MEATIILHDCLYVLKKVAGVRGSRKKAVKEAIRQLLMGRPPVVGGTVRFAYVRLMPHGVVKGTVYATTHVEHIDHGIEIALDLALTQPGVTSVLLFEKLL